MHGPFSLIASNLNKAILRSSGVYLLAHKTSKGMAILYVGRSENLRQRLNHYIGKYNYFFFKTTETVNGAFFAECREFHRYGKANYLNNRIHPAVPAGTSLPSCSERGCKGEAY